MSVGCVRERLAVLDGRLHLNALVRKVVTVLWRAHGQPNGQARLAEISAEGTSYRGVAESVAKGGGGGYLDALVHAVGLEGVAVRQQLAAVEALDPLHALLLRATRRLCVVRAGNLQPRRLTIRPDLKTQRHIGVRKTQPSKEGR